MIIPKKLKLTHRVLKNVARPVEFKYPAQLEQLGMMMHGFMRECNGIGLAAPQVGISWRVFVMQVNGVPRTCFNPEAHWATEDQLFEHEEGCLSFPDQFLIIRRPRKILARYQDCFGTWHEHELEELEAICYQHELDHLDGITMHDRVENDTGHRTISTT
jgi:peptide deformylase